MGFLLFAGAITALTHTGLTVDALSKLVPNWLLDALAITYGIGGLLILLGMARNKGNWEAAGCILTLSGLAVRAVALLYALGFTPATLSTSLFYVVFGWACLERFRQIIRGDQIIRVHQDIEVRFDSEGDSNASSE